jgi:hypothetical protein
MMTEHHRGYVGLPSLHGFDSNTDSNTDGHLGDIRAYSHRRPVWSSSRAASRMIVAGYEERLHSSPLVIQSLRPAPYPARVHKSIVARDAGDRTSGLIHNFGWGVRSGVHMISHNLIPGEATKFICWSPSSFSAIPIQLTPPEFTRILTGSLRQCER